LYHEQIYFLITRTHEPFGFRTKENNFSFRPTTSVHRYRNYRRPNAQRLHRPLLERLLRRRIQTPREKRLIRAQSTIQLHAHLHWAWTRSHIHWHYTCTQRYCGQRLVRKKIQPNDLLLGRFYGQRNRHFIRCRKNVSALFEI